MQQHCHTENDSHIATVHLHADIQTKRVTSSRRLILVAEDNSNGLEVHEGAPYLLEVNHTR